MADQMCVAECVEYGPAYADTIAVVVIGGNYTNKPKPLA